MTQLLGQQKELNIPFDSPTKDKELKIKIYQGDIEIKAVDRKDVLIRYKAIKSHLLVDFEQEGNGKAQGLKKISHNNIKLDISSHENKILVKSPEMKKKLIFYVEVPKAINIHVDYGFGGTTRIDHVIGNVNVESNAGDIFATHIIGIVNASTNDGDITVSFDQIPQAKTMLMTNVSGDLDISIPSTYQTNLKLKTVLGDIYSAFDVLMQERPETEVEKEKEEYFEFSHANTWSVGKLNGGGPELIIKTQGGNIYLRKNK